MGEKKFLSQFLAGIIVIPLSIKGPWIEEKYSKIPANQNIFNDSGLSVVVKKSASPLIYPLREKAHVKSIHIQGVFHSLPNFKKGIDDQPLRVGLIIEGEKKLNFAQKILAADWVKRIFEMASSDRGIDRIYFYNVTQDPHQVGLSRQHPLSDLIWESYFAHIDAPQKFDYIIPSTHSEKTLGLWIGIDGDDTQSSYQVDINKLTLETD
jgi:hypothetical protein